MCIYVNMYSRTPEYIRTHVHTHIDTHTRTHTHTHTHTHVYIHVGGLLLFDWLNSELQKNKAKLGMAWVA